MIDLGFIDDADLSTLVVVLMLLYQQTLGHTKEIEQLKSSVKEEVTIIAQDILSDQEQRIQSVYNCELAIKQSSANLASIASTEAKRLLDVSKDLKGMLDKMRACLRRLCFQQGKVTAASVTAIGLSVVLGSVGTVVLQNKYPEFLPERIGEMEVR